MLTLFCKGYHFCFLGGWFIKNNLFILWVISFIRGVRIEKEGKG